MHFWTDWLSCMGQNVPWEKGMGQNVRWYPFEIKEWYFGCQTHTDWWPDCYGFNLINTRYTSMYHDTVFARGEMRWERKKEKEGRRNKKGGGVADMLNWSDRTGINEPTSIRLDPNPIWLRCVPGPCPVEGTCLDHLLPNWRHLLESISLALPRRGEWDFYFFIFSVLGCIRNILIIWLQGSFGLAWKPKGRVFGRIFYLIDCKFSSCN